MTITKEQWQKIEEELSYGFVSVKFGYKDHELSVERVRLSESKTGLAVYINGAINQGWGFANSDSFNERPEIIEDVWKAATKAYYTAKDIKHIEKCWGKRRAKRECPRLYERATYYKAIFPKASVLCRQFKKLENLTLIKADCLEAVTE